MQADGRGAARPWSRAARIATTAWLILFVELALIRFIGGYVRVFAFYTNFVIIAAFLGMGTGMLRRHTADRLGWTLPIVLVLLFGLVALLARSTIDVGDNNQEWLRGAEAAAGAYVGLPVLFASFLFSRAYAGSPDPTAALAFNILGAVAGGVLEYGSMTVGLDALGLMIVALHVGAVLILLRRPRHAESAPPGTVPQSV